MYMSGPEPEFTPVGYCNILLQIGWLVTLSAGRYLTQVFRRL